MSAETASVERRLPRKLRVVVVGVVSARGVRGFGQDGNAQLQVALQLPTVTMAELLQRPRGAVWMELQIAPMVVLQRAEMHLLQEVVLRWAEMQFLLRRRLRRAELLLLEVVVSVLHQVAIQLIFHASASPEATGGWEVFEVAGSWVKYNQELAKLDAHCSVHRLCKMDRVLSRRVLGLHMAWLQAADTGITRERHQELKWEFSQEAEYGRRVVGREEWRDLCVLRLPEHPMVRAMQQEEEITGTADEPVCIPCILPPQWRGA